MRARFAALTLVLALVLGEPVPREGAAQSAPEPLQPVQLQVTGDPTPLETLRLAILTTARAVVPEGRNGRVTLSETAPPLQPLPEASAMTLRAIVQFAGVGGKPLTRMIPLEISNAVVPWTDAQMLFVSNSPETLPFGKVLFNGELSTGDTMRLLYHHGNGSSTQHMVIAVNLTNPDSTPINLWVMGATGNPGGDELSTGHSAAREFLLQYWHHAGFILQIPANTTLPIFFNELAPQAVASGLVQLKMLDGDHLNLQVFARLEGETDPPATSFSANFDTVHQRGVFDHPWFTRPLAYTVGEAAPLVMMVGDDHDSLRESQSGVALNGNYGVVYTFRVDINNPGPLPAVLALVLHAIGGQASGTVLIDDRIVDVPRVKSGDRQVVTKIRLAPRERRIVTIATMPESGANYPIRLLLASPQYF
jgi:hypothetical protein